MTPDYEKLGVFYLGKKRDLKANRTTDELMLYDSKDLTTHAVVVGMTGSGKTGLCLTMLEEAGIDNIPAIVIDPKGDISNLLLTFPDLSPADFLPWVEEGQALRNGLSIEEFAAQQSKLWKGGLEKWQQDGERIRRFRNSVDLTVYTPGSSAGVPLTILRSFDAPPAELLEDSDALRERIQTSASGLLALLGIDADPVKSREHILISKILDDAWRQGKNLDLANLIQAIQKPPFQKIGIVELDQFFSEKDRFDLSMTLNNLLASPSFESWLVGEPLDIKKMFYSNEGKPRISIISIAHLSDAERMFFVTILLNEVLSWMRRQSGTSSLRSILYMDEVFGYFPPSANPPSKIPMLTLLKQARAFGLGVVLATQNPVDLDYKGLSNTGTWFLGRLQTERDKMRVLEGLEGAATSTGASFDRGEMEQILAGLSNRVFLMNNVHDDHPVVFETRWAMSYLRGPLTRDHIKKLMQEKRQAQATLQTSSTKSKEALAEGEAGAVPKAKPSAPRGVKEYFLTLARTVQPRERVIYRPALFATTRLHFAKSTYNVDAWESRSFLFPMRGEVPADVWDQAELVTETLTFTTTPMEGAEYSEFPESLAISKNFERWENELPSFLYRTQEFVVFSSAELNQFSRPGESEGDFRARLQQFAREQRDLEAEKLRKKYASKFAALDARVHRAAEKIQKEKEQYSQKRLDSVLSVGTSILGALLGRKMKSVTNVTRAGSAMRSAGKMAQEKADVGRAEESLEQLQQDKVDLETEFQSEVDKIAEQLAVEALQLARLVITAKKSDITTEKFGILWMPWRVDSAGIAEPAYETEA